MADPLPIWKEEYEKTPAALPVWKEPEPSLFQRGVTAGTESMGKIFAAPGEAGLQALNALGLREDSPEAAAGGLAAGQQAGTDVAKFVVPQTPIEAGALAGTLVAPPLAAARPLATAITKLGPKLGPVLTRILGGAVGGEAGGLASGETPGKGTLVGGGTNVAGEVVGAGGGKIVRSLPWMKGVINRADAARIGRTAGEISPPLAGAKTGKDFQGLVEDRGLSALGAAKEEALARVEGMLPGKQGPPWTAEFPAGAIRAPSLKTRELPFDSSRPAGISLRDASDELSRIGELLSSRQPLDPNVSRVDLARRYGELVAEIGQGLEQAGGPEARAAWEAGQTAYRKGRGIYDFLRDTKVLEPGGVTSPLIDEGSLNIVKLQRSLMDPTVAADLRKALGPEDFDRLAQAIFRGADRTKIDRMALGGGGPLDALMQVLRGQNTGFSQTWRVPIATVLPNLGSQYAGRAPYSLPPALQAILDVALQRMGGSAMAPEARR